MAYHLFAGKKSPQGAGVDYIDYMWVKVAVFAVLAFIGGLFGWLK